MQLSQCIPRGGWPLSLLLAAGLTAATVGAQQRTLQATPAAASSTPYTSVLREADVMMTARDGVKLATDIYRPAASGHATPEKLPVLLHRTPYDKDAPATIAIARALAQHGYIVVVQDTRGRHTLAASSRSTTSTTRTTATTPSSGRRRSPTATARWACLAPPTPRTRRPTPPS